jgi:peptidyl-prolyl cis-trans isomerase C
MKKSFFTRDTLIAFGSGLALLTGNLVAAAAESSPSQADVLVTWRDMRLTRQDFEADMLRLPANKRDEFREDLKRITSDLESLLIYRTLASEARAMGLDQDPLVRTSVELAVDRVLGTERLNRFRAGIKVPDMTAAAKEKYLAEQAKFQVPERVHVMHVLIDTKARSDDEARRRADEVREKALAGADFGKLVQEYSDDPSAKANQGDLGFFSRGKMLPQFEEAAFALTKTGEISVVVKTRFGYHVIRLVDRKPARLRPFDEVRDELVRQLQDQYVTDRVQEYISAIRNDKSIKLNTEAIDALVINPEAVPPAP